MPFMLLYALYYNNFKSVAFIDYYSIVYLSLILLSLVLIMFLPLDIPIASTNIIRMTGVYVCVLLTTEILSYKRYNFIAIFLIAFVISYYIIVIYLLIGTRDIDVSSGKYIYRRGFELNANTYSYFSFFANIAIFYLIEIKKRNIYIYLSLITTVIGLYVSFLTSSRSGLLFTLIIAVLYWLFINRSYKINNMFRIFIFSVFSFYFMIKVYEFYNNSYLKFRVDESVQFGDTRTNLFKDAFNIFKEHPFTGVGPGQYSLYSYYDGTFSHNSFSESAANLGIVGLLLLIFLLVNPLRSSIKMYLGRGYNVYNNLLKLNILFFSFFILYNNFYVFYLTTYGMIFFIVIINIQKNIKYGIHEI